MDIEAIRAGIPALETGVYVNTGWSGPSPRRVLDAIHNYLEFEAAEGPTSITGFSRRLEVDRAARRAYASVLGCEPAEVALTDNTTEGVNIVFNGLPWKDGDRLVITGVEHPGIEVPAVFMAKRRSLDLHRVECDAAASPQAVIDGFDRAITPGTRLVALSHVSFANGMRLPLKEIVEISHSRGAFVVADGAQTAGQIAIDVGDLGIDAYAVPGHKWLCGPDGTGALFVRRDRIPDLLPTKVGYWAMASHEPDGSFDENTTDARRYQVSTMNGGLWAGTTEAIAMVQEIGQDAVEERSVQLASYAVRKLMATSGVRVVSPREGAAVSGLVCFQVEGVDPDAVTGSLWERNRVVCRSVESTASTRLSLAFFNTEEDVDRAVEGAAQVANQGPVDVESTEWWRVMKANMDEV